MAPWVGRLRDGRFTFDGTTHQLAVEPHRRGRQPPRHPRHRVRRGMDRGRRSTPRRHHPALPARHGARLALRRHRPADDHAWPTTALRCELSVDTDGEPFPAAIGWHPWFRKPDRLTFEPDGDVRAGRHRPARPPSSSPPVAGPWDDCFVNHRPGRAALPDRADRHRRSRSRPTATTGWSTTSRPTPRASNRSPVRPTPSTMRPRAGHAGASRSRRMMTDLLDVDVAVWDRRRGLPGGNRAPIASPECHRPDSILIPRSRSRT